MGQVTIYLDQETERKLQAFQNGLTLVSRNLREFDRIEGLRVVDWF